MVIHVFCFVLLKRSILIKQSSYQSVDNLQSILLLYLSDPLFLLLYFVYYVFMNVSPQAVREEHLTRTANGGPKTGTLGQGLRALRIAAQTYTDPANPIPLVTGTTYKISAITFGGGGGLMKGALLRVACQDTRAFTVTGDGITGQAATSVCASEQDGAQGVMHRNASGKTEVTGSLVVDFNSRCTLDVTVVDSNNNVDGSVYWYSQYTLDFSGGGTPPTAAPPAPTPQPAVCFSGETLVTVQNSDIAENKRANSPTTTTKRMDQLKIGDLVLTGGTAGGDDESHYSKVYSFGHYDPNVQTEYLQIMFTNSKAVPLEITANHLMYRYAEDNTHEIVPASKIRVGDKLVSSATATVHEIRKVTRRGAYSPLTTKGNIVVSGVLTSNYVSREWLNANWVSGPMLHFLQHGAAVPYRFYCAVVGGCDGETYNDETGFSPWVMFWYRIEQWQLGLHPILQGLFLMMLALPAAVPVIVGMLLTVPPSTTAMHLIVFLIGYYIWKKTNGSKSGSVPSTSNGLNK